MSGEGGGWGAGLGDGHTSIMRTVNYVGLSPQVWGREWGGGGGDIHYRVYFPFDTVSMCSRNVRSFPQNIYNQQQLEAQYLSLSVSECFVFFNTCIRGHVKTHSIICSIYQLCTAFTIGPICWLKPAAEYRGGSQ